MQIHELLDQEGTGIAATLFAASSVTAQNFEIALADLTTQISDGMEESYRQKIAVVEFLNLDGEVTALGKFVSEELITRLFKAGGFQVVERRLLNKVVDEHQLDLSDLIDLSTARQLGRILGVDAICTGTVTDLVNTVRVNARLISTETGEIFSVASASMDKDSAITSLMRIRTTTDGETDGTARAQPAIAYPMDLSVVQEGLLPDGWVGGETMGVRKIGGKYGITNFARQRPIR